MIRAWWQRMLKRLWERRCLVPYEVDRFAAARKGRYM